MTNENGTNKATTACKMKMVWENEPTANCSRFRIVSDGTNIIVEHANECDALGIPRWQPSSLAELPPAGVAYIASAVLGNHQSSNMQELFFPDVDENTPEIVKQLTGHPLKFAAHVMALDIGAHTHGMKVLRELLTGHGSKRVGESVLMAAVRIISELSIGKAVAEAELSTTKKKLADLSDGAGELFGKILKVQLGALVAGEHPSPLKSTSLCRQASELIDYLVNALVVTETMTIRRL